MTTNNRSSGPSGSARENSRPTLRGQTGPQAFASTRIPRAARSVEVDPAHLAIAQILESGGHVTLGTPEARRTWLDGLPELVTVIARHFTAEELDVIVEGAS